MNTETKISALAKHLTVAAEDIEPCTYDENSFDVAAGSWLVLTDSEADDAHNERLEEYIDECLLPELPAAFQGYFDREAWKRDAQHDGRGHCLSSYDGEEHEVQVNGEWFYIYRTN